MNKISKYYNQFDLWLDIDLPIIHMELASGKPKIKITIPLWLFGYMIRKFVRLIKERYGFEEDIILKKLMNYKKIKRFDDFANKAELKQSMG